MCNLCSKLDPLDPQDFGLLDPDPQKYADPQIRIQGQNINKKLQKKILISKSKSELLKKATSTSS